MVVLVCRMKSNSTSANKLTVRWEVSVNDDLTSQQNPRTRPKARQKRSAQRTGNRAPQLPQGEEKYIVIKQRESDTRMGEVKNPQATAAKADQLRSESKMGSCFCRIFAAFVIVAQLVCCSLDGAVVLTPHKNHPRGQQRSLGPTIEGRPTLPVRQTVFHTPFPTRSSKSNSTMTSELSKRTQAAELRLAAEAPEQDSLASEHQLDAAHLESEISSRLTETTVSKPASSGNPEASALLYLQRYGYMGQESSSSNHQRGASSNLITEESFSNAIIDFQRFAGLPTTGIVDNRTMELMQLPRCGNSDKWRPPVPSFVAAREHRLDRIKRSGRLGEKFQLELRSRVGATDGGKSSLNRKRRYALQGSKWRRQELTYRISQYPSRFNGKRPEVDEQIAKAFGIWSQVAPIDFVVKREGRVHIDIRFASGDHGDGDAFDGPGNTLAHAYFPQYGGDAHFDDQEFWTIDSYAGTNIFQVAAHELGHSLGLGHSNVREALMAPFYQKYKPHFKLHLDDVLAIQALYGEKQPGPTDQPVSSGPASPTSAASVPPTTPATQTPSKKPFARFPIYKGARRPSSEPEESTSARPPPSIDGLEKDTPLGTPSESQPTDFGRPFASDGAAVPYPADLCSDPMIDAITRTEDGNSYVFKGHYYWLLAQEGLAKGYPRRIEHDWEGLPGNLDAALTWADGKTFFFKGNKYWRFRNKKRDVGYPKLISSGFAGIPDDIDAAFVWSGNGRTYFFKGTEYWRFDSKADPPVSSEYPRPIKVWLGVPSYLNAAFKWENNVTYFFKGNQYYRFNDREFRVESRGRPPFPRSIGEWWFGCVSSNLAQRAFPSTLAYNSPSLDEGLPPQLDAVVVERHQQPSMTVVGDPPGDWSLLAGHEENSRSMGTHISDHSGRQPPQEALEQTPVVGPHSGLGGQDEGPAGGESGGHSLVITVDGPSGIQANSARQPRQHTGLGSRMDDHGPPTLGTRLGGQHSTIPAGAFPYGSGWQRSASSAACRVTQSTAQWSLLAISSAILIISLHQLSTAGFHSRHWSSKR